METEVNLSYYDIGQLLDVKYLYPASMRFPGGAVANYWNFSNASYVTPCKTSNYDCYNPEYNIDQ